MKRCSKHPSVRASVGPSELSSIPRGARHAQPCRETLICHARAGIILCKFTRGVVGCASTAFAPRARVPFGKSFLGELTEPSGTMSWRKRTGGNILPLNELILQRVTDIGCMTSFRYSSPGVHSAWADNRTRDASMATVFSTTRPLKQKAQYVHVGWGFTGAISLTSAPSDKKGCWGSYGVAGCMRWCASSVCVLVRCST